MNDPKRYDWDDQPDHIDWDYYDYAEKYAPFSNDIFDDFEEGYYYEEDEYDF